ncbi:MAG: hypothetical protein Hyperionvirus11_32 [Hyperionvirus sp.]|uniref:Uncharacterized protein n=1 Tax=Hyperionvirus sp. TaxID=2487770 RepID=A0A3G5AEG1_9VIRU|nr:MAG: hypothetical protein Hyperionvirus11_32 [Hyperionvirus sp.]
MGAVDLEKLVKLASEHVEITCDFGLEDSKTDKYHSDERKVLQIHAYENSRGAQKN